MKGKTLSIRSIIVIVFILILTVSICCIASFIIMNWISSSRYAMGEMSDCINRSIRVRVESFLQSSENMEKLSRGAIDRSVIDGFNDFLVEAVGEYEGLAFIVESGTEKVVANSLHIDNYEIGRDGTLKIYEINEIDNATLVRIYEKYLEEMESGDDGFSVKVNDENMHADAVRLEREDLNWIIVSAIPERLLLKDIHNSIAITVLLMLIALAVSIAVYLHAIDKLFRPIEGLLETSEVLASGSDLSKRALVIRNDEIGRISAAFNKVADKMQSIVSNLEQTVSERTKEMHHAVEELEKNKDQLRLILDSTAEAIFGIDLTGKCTFCNRSCIETLGYSCEDDLLNRNVHLQIHHSRRDRSPIKIEDCKIMESVRSGVGSAASDEVFWKADGTPIDVRYHAYPQFRNGQVVGAVVTFMDITEQKKDEERIRFLSTHDSMTGLLNRRGFEGELSNFDKEENLPISILFADINGLKLANDIYGHSAGDELIIRSAEIIKSVCRENDIAARVGGDEFIILMPRTPLSEARKVMEAIKEKSSKVMVRKLRHSISVGVDVKLSPDKGIERTMENAENEMYIEKSMTGKIYGTMALDDIMNELFKKSSREKDHANEVSRICAEIGKELKLSGTEVKKLREAGYYHDIGKITLSKELLNKDYESWTISDREKMNQHILIGYRILNLFEATLDLADSVYYHHEQWDGSGYPKGLRGEEIPFISRVVAVAETFERAYGESASPSEGRVRAIEKLRMGSGKQYDPSIVDALIRIVDNGKI
ncbi:MAG: diguanylate cyclase [Clostridiales bacterium]|nr:diguanylate cyclase [Clostridiales bacterium]